MAGAKIELERPDQGGVPLRVVVALGLGASLVARCLAPALRGVAGDSAIIWASRAAALLTLLSATGLVAGVARLASVIVSAPRAPFVARLIVVPAVAFGCMLLLFASFRPLEPFLALVLGISAAIVGSLAARHTVADTSKRAVSLVLGLTSSAGLTHVLSRKLTQDASDAANLAAFRSALAIETLGLTLDVLAIALSLLWLKRRMKHGSLLVSLIFLLAALGVWLSWRGSAPGAGALSALLKAGLKELGRDQVSFLPGSVASSLSALGFTTAAVALFGGTGELGLVVAACLLARASLDIPIPALLLELGALYLPLARSPASIDVPARAPESPPLADTPPP